MLSYIHIPSLFLISAGPTVPRWLSDKCHVHLTALANWILSDFAHETQIA